MAASQSVDQPIVDEFVGNAHGNFARVQEIYQQHPQVLNAVASWNETALGAASQMGCKDIAQFLLAEGAPLDIFTAAMMGMTDNVTEFLEQDPNLIHARGPHSIPVLFYPGIHGYKEIAELLLARGAEINAGEGSYPPIHAAANFGQNQMVRWYLEHGANVNGRDYDNKTPLYRAIERGHTETADLLRQHGGTEE